MCSVESKEVGGVESKEVGGGVENKEVVVESKVIDVWRARR